MDGTADAGGAEAAGRGGADGGAVHLLTGEAASVAVLAAAVAAGRVRCRLAARAASRAASWTWLWAVDIRPAATISSRMSSTAGVATANSNAAEPASSPDLLVPCSPVHGRRVVGGVGEAFDGAGGVRGDGEGQAGQ